MKTAKTLIGLAMAACLAAASAQAGAPLPGIYKSQNGQVLHGRHTESFAGGAQHLTVGNAINGASWNGASLGTQWSYKCPDITSVVLLADLVNPVTGNGQKIYSKFFTGGTFAMNGTGEAWDGGDAAYSGVISSYTERTTIIYQAFVRVNETSNITWSGHFTGFRYPCVQWSANGATVGSTDGGASLPAGYPPFVSPTTCNADRSYGVWWQHTDVTVNIIECTVPAQESTWGGIKSLYTD